MGHAPYIGASTFLVRCATAALPGSWPKTCGTHCSRIHRDEIGSFETSRLANGISCSPSKIPKSPINAITGGAGERTFNTPYITPTSKPAANDNTYTFMASLYGRTWELVFSGGREHRLGVDHAESVGAAVHAGNVHRLRISFAARPIALQFEQVLERGHRPRPGLHHADHCALMRLFGNIPAGIGDHVHLEPLIERRKRRADDAHTSPQACENDPAFADLIDPLDDVRVFPRVHRGAIDDFVLREHRANLLVDRSREAFLGNGRQNRGDLELPRPLCNQGAIVP